MFSRYGSTSDRHNDDDDDDADDTHKLDVARCDHYASDDDDRSGGGGGLTPLVGRQKRTTSKRQFSSRRSSGPSSLANCTAKALFRFLLLALLLLAALLTYYQFHRLQLEISSLSAQISSLSKNTTDLAGIAASTSRKFDELNSTVAAHDKIIGRFENSVSNSDVLERLAALEGEWNESQKRLEGEMEDTKEEIRGVLDSTKKSIDQTVSQAQEEINTQVRTVQSTLSTYIRTTQDQFSTENSFMIYQLAGTFTLLTCLISMWHMTSHLRSFQQPFVQRKILAILWMCPIYGVTSWLSLVIPTMEGYLAILKDLYEAYVIYQFLSFLIAVLGKGDREAVVKLLATHADHLSPPVRCFGWCRKNTKHYDDDIRQRQHQRSYQSQRNETSTVLSEETDRDPEEDEERRHSLADEVLLQCQIFAMQFVFFRPVLTAALFVLKKIDYYGPIMGVFHFHIGNFTVGEDANGEYDEDAGIGTMGYRSPQFYLVVMENLSVFLAFSGLLKFYHAVQEDLSWCRPFPKFLCIKGVVFMTFWQGIAISLLADTTDILGGDSTSGEYIPNNEDQEKWAKQAQNFLICLEMLGFAIAHFYCFPVEEWEEGYRPKQNQGKFGDNMALGDFMHDLKLILRHNEKKKRLSKLKSDGKPSDDSITTVLEEEEELGFSDDGLQSLLSNMDEYLENRAGGTDENEKDHDQRQRGSTAEKSTPGRKYRSSIQESLEAMNAPIELRNATALLLQCSLLDEETSRLLASDILDQSLDNQKKLTGAKDEGSGLVALSEDTPAEENTDRVVSTQSSSYTYGENALSTLESDPPQQPPHDEAGGDEDSASDSKSLLSASSKNEKMLNPSIFTMHSS